MIQETKHYPIIAVRISLVTYSMIKELNAGIEPPEDSLDTPTFLIYETDPDKRNTIIPEGYFKDNYAVIGGDASMTCVVRERYPEPEPNKDDE